MKGISRQREKGEGGEIGYKKREHTCETVFSKTKFSQLKQKAQLGWDSSRQPIVEEIDVPESRAVGEGSGKASFQQVVIEVHRAQAREAA